MRKTMKPFERIILVLLIRPILVQNKKVKKRPPSKHQKRRKHLRLYPHLLTHLTPKKKPKRKSNT